MAIEQAVLALNSGSSSLKFGLFAPGQDNEVLLLEGSAEGIGRENGSLRLRSADGSVLLEQTHVLESQQEALQKAASVLKDHPYKIAAVGHRIVHGGPHLLEHQQVTPALLNTLRESVHFAPVHIPQALELLQQAAVIFPSVPHFACFDTAFHRSMPAVASHLPLPERYFQQGLRHYGFHGLSYESLVVALENSLPSRAIFAHLGNGSSVVAVRDGVSIDTSMGFTPTGGVLMGTRSGDLDPGVLLYLMRTEQMNADALETFVNRNCGMFGLSEGESDMQALLQREAAGDEQAVLAVTAFCTSVKKCIGSYAALLGGVDLLVFTGGIGQHSETIRNRICAGLAFLDPSGQLRDAPTIIAIEAKEELQIARHVRCLLRETNQ